jgi:beta-glucosidase
VGAGDRVTVLADVTNLGPAAGDEVAQLYTRRRERGRVDQPRLRLRGFERVSLRPGETAVVRFPLPIADLAIWDVTRGRFAVEPGAYDLLVGRSSADIQLGAALEVAGEPIPPRAVRGVETRAADFDDQDRTCLVDETRTRGDAVAPAGARGWIAFTDVDLGPGVDGFSALVSTAGRGAGGIQLRLDDPAAGRVIGRLEVPCTRDRYAWTWTTTRLHGAAGVRDLYLVLVGAVRVAAFSFR